MNKNLKKYASKEDSPPPQKKIYNQLHNKYYLNKL
jgi:hypothetical protein